MQKLSSCIALAGLIFLAACHDDHNGASPALSLSGSVSGLTGTGLVLVDGTHSVAVASGGTTFTVSGS